MVSGLTIDSTHRKVLKEGMETFLNDNSDIEIEVGKVAKLGDKICLVEERT